MSRVVFRDKYRVEYRIQGFSGKYPRRIVLPKHILILIFLRLF